MSEDLRLFACPSCQAFNRIPSSRVGDAPKCGKCKTALDVSGAPIKLTDETFAAFVARSPVPVLLDIWAPWCGPCRMVAPVLEAIGKDKAGKLIVAKLDSDENPRTAQALGVRSIPTLIVYSAGKPVERVSGALPRPQIEKMLAPHMA